MQINKELLLKYNTAGPRYTSYPPANFFHSDFSVENHIENIKLSNNQQPENISLYIHIPFCPQQCHFCGCNTHIGTPRNEIEAYINALILEIKNTVRLLSSNRKVTQIHWGGGTPNAIAIRFIEMVMNTISQEFTLLDNCEIAIECSPAYMNKEQIKQLSDLGFNRISLGIQDFREDVLNAVNRKSSKLPVEDLMVTIRSTSISSINLDFIYGLPLQTQESFLKTIEQAISLKPDRLVTFSYAHVPWVKGSQKVLEDIGLPTPTEKLDLFTTSMKQMLEAGYHSIGIDHYALPDDELSLALKTKNLHRNFQGYCTKETTGQVYAFGASSICQMQGAYSQNTKDINKYIEKINSDGFATEKGYQLSTNEQIVRSVINEIMCNGFLSFKEIAGEYSISEEEVKNIISFNKEKLSEFIKDGLIELTDESITVNDSGRLVVRNIAMALDPALQKGDTKYSKTI